jgi:hypothetical protein
MPTTSSQLPVQHSVSAVQPMPVAVQVGPASGPLPLLPPQANVVTVSASMSR